MHDCMHVIATVLAVLAVAPIRTCCCLCIKGTPRDTEHGACVNSIKHDKCISECAAWHGMAILNGHLYLRAQATVAVADALGPMLLDFPPLPSPMTQALTQEPYQQESYMPCCTCNAVASIICHVGVSHVSSCTAAILKESLQPSIHFRDAKHVQSGAVVLHRCPTAACKA